MSHHGDPNEFRRQSAARETILRDPLRSDRTEQIVHDLKNPLSAIALETSLLGEALVERSHVEVKSSLSRIARNIDFLDRMVHDLLDSAAIHAGRFTLAREPTELRGLLGAAIDRVVTTRDRPRVALIAPDPAMVSIDAIRIERVIANLLDNALKHAPGSQIEIQLDAYPDRVAISVLDGGPGGPASETTGVFEKYRRARGIGVQDGSALGLYVSKVIVEAHGGTIGLDRVPGHRSRFIVALPTVA